MSDEASDLRRVRAEVSGNVQGVFFRDSTRQKAQDLGLSGYVRNTPDGQVEVEFEGPSDQVDEALDFCRQGPDMADVNDVESEEIETQDDDGFEVRS
ncbi:MAG: acylphosphatase [Egibacteraceae bacterium]